MIAFMGGALAQLTNLVGGNVANRSKVGGQLGYTVQDTIPNYEKKKLTKLSQLPKRATKADVLKATEAAAKAEAGVELLRELSNQKCKEAAALVQARNVRIAHVEKAWNTANQVAEKDADFLRFLMGAGLVHDQAEAKVSGYQQAYNGVAGLFD